VHCLPNGNIIPSWGCSVKPLEKSNKRQENKVLR
jgi:hypothetical protein